MITLVVEASTYHGSAALVDGSVVLGERSVAMRGREHEALMPAVAELLGEAGMAPARLARIVCGAGPGSFTSLRIAGSIAKGLALACGAPLVPLSSLALQVACLELPKPGLYLATVDAMRGESYAAPYSLAASGLIQPEGAVQLVPTAQLEQLAASRGALVIGPACHAEAHAIPHARGAALLTNLIDASPSADLAGWEPGYGRLAEAQVKWEADHGRPLPV